MKAWTRWQDWVNVVAGVCLFASPIVLNFSMVASAAWSAWILGVLVLGVAVYALARPESEAPEWCNALLGVVTVAAPWVFGFATMTNVVLYSFVVTGLIVLAMSGHALYDIRSRVSRTAH